MARYREITHPDITAHYWYTRLEVNKALQLTSDAGSSLWVESHAHENYPHPLLYSFFPL